MTVDEHGIICSARIDENGRVSKFDPPQILVRTPLKTGATWNFDGKIGETKVSQRYEITGEEDTVVAAGKLRTGRHPNGQNWRGPAHVDPRVNPRYGISAV